MLNRLSDRRNKQLKQHLVVASVFVVGIMGAAYAMSTTLAMPSNAETTTSKNTQAPRSEPDALDMARHDDEPKDSEPLTKRQAPEREADARQQPSAQADEVSGDVRKPAPSSKPVFSQPSSTLAASLLSEVNKRRSAAGQPALSADQRLDGSAQAKCDDMTEHDYFAHDHPKTGKSGIEYARAAVGPYGTWGENLITGYAANASAVYDGWWASPSHKTAALNSKYERTGYGICGNTAYPTIVQHFYGG